MQTLLFITIATAMNLCIIYTGQIFIPQGLNTRCYSTADCTGPINRQFCQLFDENNLNINHCCYDLSSSMPRSGLNMLSFTINGGGCRRCDGKTLASCMQPLTCIVIINKIIRCMCIYVCVFVCVCVCVCVCV